MTTSMAMRLRRFVISYRQKRFVITTATTSPSANAATLLFHTSSPPSTTRANSSSPSPCFTVQFLINSCGLSLESALSVSQKTKFQLRENKLQNPRSVVQFLKAYNFTNTQIAKLIEKQPNVLRTGVEVVLKPKFDFFVKNGFVDEILPEFIVSDPVVLGRGLDSHIKPSFELLKSLFGSNEKTIEALLRVPCLLSFNFKCALKPNIELLIKEGVPVHKVAKLVMMHPRAMLHKHDKVTNGVNALKNLGIEPKAPVFVHAMRVIFEMNESTRKKKIDMLKSFGWSEEEIWGAFKRNPNFLSRSEEKIRRMVDFLVNTLKFKPSTVILRPELLAYSIDRRLLPRHNVWEVLGSNKLIKDGKNKLQILFFISEKDFLENYVTKYAEKVPGLLQIYGATSKAKKIDT